MTLRLGCAKCNPPACCWIPAPIQLQLAYTVRNQQTASKWKKMSLPTEEKIPQRGTWISSYSCPPRVSAISARKYPSLLHHVKCGSCNTPKPGFFDFEGKQKWEAWKALGDTSTEQAMRDYIATVKKLDPTWNPQITEKKGKEGKAGFGGPVVSSLYQEETIREEDKNIFDYCRENNIDHVTKAIRSKKVDVNMKDEKGRALLHWACDRGHKELASVLLQHTADVNSQDDEGQTALHYASTCEFSDIVELLLKSGADPTLRDIEGYLPEEVTDCRVITSMLQEHTAGKA
ncbi:acyl-CoA-binding domain-containing protein 6 isoform X1 [Sceloporus undulatus]|uniref:acyl-CoA-binding domain-containing protein 6 isoform X1 n=1 Tax=Sceloporus undulatus TaxID=8520 RepID=UPI001C4B13B4|nr:acyl-CoA-binding domain-containing protein 6 isoform X1 [Sceloporus undulatus]